MLLPRQCKHEYLCSTNNDVEQHEAEHDRLKIERLGGEVELPLERVEVVFRSHTSP